MCGGGGKAPEPPKYTTVDGRTFDTAWEASEHDRMVRLARAMGYEGDFGVKYGVPQGATSPNAFAARTWLDFLQGRGQPVLPVDPFEQWLQEDEERQQLWKEFYDTGLTAGDYRAEQRRREEEARREAAIAQGRELIESQFGQFDDSYYDTLRQNYLDYYMPQLDTQYQRALESTTYDLARRGLLNSSAANRKLADLNEALAVQRGTIANQAEDVAAKQRAQVLADRDTLLNFNQSAADAETVSERVGGVTDRLMSYAPQLTPLGQVFYDFITPVTDIAARGIRAQQMGYPGWSVVGGRGGYDTRSRRSYQEVR